MSVKSSVVFGFLVIQQCHEGQLFRETKATMPNNASDSMMFPLPSWAGGVLSWVVF